MSWPHQDRAAQLEGIPPAAKSVLLHLAYPACETCGLVWAGRKWLARVTGLGGTAITQALEWLVKEGHLTIHAYPKGGRGRSTEYVVLPQLLELSTPRCGQCRRKQERSREPVGIDDGMTPKPTARREVLVKPTAETPQNLPPGVHQSVIESQSVTPLRGAAESSPPARPEAPSDPTPWAENAAQARKLADLFSVTPPPDRAPAVNSDLSGAETASHHEEAQD